MSAAGGRWKVEYQTETIGLGPDGRPTEGVKVGFKVHASGVVASVFVPKMGYNANRVSAAINDYLAHLDAVHNLSG